MNMNLSEGKSKPWPTPTIIHTDGACRGNPGPSSIAFVALSETGDEIYHYAEAIGSTTNNVAEYKAVVAALTAASQSGSKEIHLKSDSQLLIRQLNGEYKVKAEHIIGLHQQCIKLIKGIGKVHLSHVRREENTAADELANKVLNLNGF